jgi:quercetin dioxygenase-like cupin family protein
MTRMWKGQAFTIAHADAGEFEGKGLRAFFEYRQLRIAEATGGKYGAHVIRAVPGRHSEAAWHTHELDFQMVYVTKGWVVFEYEGPDGKPQEHILREGSCVLQPPGIRHREVRHSDDLELIEITSPAEFATQAADAPD